jgi:hypothetical protein
MWCKLDTKISICRKNPPLQGISATFNGLVLLDLPQRCSKSGQSNLRSWEDKTLCQNLIPHPSNYIIPGQNLSILIKMTSLFIVRSIFLFVILEKNSVIGQFAIYGLTATNIGQLNVHYSSGQQWVEWRPWYPC